MEIDLHHWFDWLQVPHVVVTFTDVAVADEIVVIVEVVALGFERRSISVVIVGIMP